MLRASSYNIYVDLTDDCGEMLLVHGYTGAYDKVSRKVGNYVRSLEINSHKPLWGEWSGSRSALDMTGPPSEQTISTLKRRGYLTEKSVEDEEQSFIKVAKTLHAHSNKPGYIFIPTYNCNLRCAYCFQDHMRTDASYNHLLRTMTTELVDRIFAAMVKIDLYHGIAEDQTQQRQIGLFGGEPLIKESRPIVEYIIKKAQTRSNTFIYAITNGTDLQYYEDLLGPNKISYLQITLDGPPKEHNKRRIYADGQGSFEIIAQNITKALDLGVQVGIRMNVDRLNVAQLPELADEIVKRGWQKYSNFDTYATPIHAANLNVVRSTTFNSYELDLAVDELRESHPNMRVIGRPDESMKQRVHSIFKKNSSPTLKSTFCGAHNGMYIFDPFGDIYACWERTGDKRIRIGAVTSDNDFMLEKELTAMWRSRNVTTNPTCLKCRYALHCGGGCAILAEQKSGTMFSNYCDAFGKRFNYTVAETYLEHASGVEFKEKAERACDL